MQCSLVLFGLIECIFEGVFIAIFANMHGTLREQELQSVTPTND